MIVITGASDGIGLELAKLYKNVGNKVANVSRRKSEFADINVLHDLREASEIKIAAESIKNIGDPVEAIINCIGIYSDAKFGSINNKEAQNLMSVNVNAPMIFISELIDRIQKDGSDILNVVSKAGTLGSKDTPLYAASKWAERGFTLSLQQLLKDTPSRVISFCPGGIKTKLFEKTGTNTDVENWMEPTDIALFIKQILDLPKNIEVSEILINRKSLV